MAIIVLSLAAWAAFFGIWVANGAKTAAKLAEEDALWREGKHDSRTGEPSNAEILGCEIYSSEWRTVGLDPEVDDLSGPCVQVG
mmetsp:Transcript_10666/g.16736  ORF Transcript_10666/g.16736 Transcript_10666/m.16736 type:complete len:84 (-) Transcript_10666:1250-1501(-)